MVSHLANAALRASLTSRVHILSASSSSSSSLARCCRRHLRQLDPLLRQCSSYSSRAASQSTRRRPQWRHHGRSRCRPGTRSYAAASSVPQLPKEIAVLGGGLTGLTTAYYLTRFHPDAKITLYEASDRLGGWIDTDRVQVMTEEGEEAAVTLERGARAVSPQHGLGRWEDFVLFDLIEQLGLYELPDDHPDAPSKITRRDAILSRRYMYYPDHLVQLPGAPDAKTFLSGLSWFLGTAKQVLTEPLFEGALSSAKNLYRQDVEVKWKWQQDRPKGLPPRIAIADHQDMSAGAFLQNAFGRPDLVNNMVSALYHGIWGGDIWKLSAAETTLQNMFFQLQHSGLGMSVVRDHDYDSGRDLVARNPRIPEVWRSFGASAGFLGFHGGFGTLTNAIADVLRRDDNVTIKTGTPVTNIRYEKEEGKAVVCSSPTEEHKYDKVISSLYSGTLAGLTGDTLPALKKSTAVTIQVVNLWFPRSLLNDPHRGFGYLIPQSVPVQDNPHAALGVIFDSDREAAAGTPEYASVGGTKLTVMLGGHYWDYLQPESWPDAQEAAAMAIHTVNHQLGISPAEPVYASTKVCRECIPQHLVGHRARMAQAHTELYESFRGTLAVVGSSYTSPGVLPNLKAARDMALKIAGQGYKTGEGGMESYMTHVGETGLGRFYGKNETFRLVPRQMLPFRDGSSKRLFNMKI